MSSVTNLARNLTETTRIHAGRVAVRVDNAAMTYRALDEASARVAGLLHERGLKPGDRVGIMMPNVAEVPVVYYGVLRAGGVVVPMNPLLKAREVAYYLGDSGAGLMFAWHAFADQARGGAEQAEAECIVVDGVSFPDLLASAAADDQVADTGDEETAVILYTSGTTGHPKGAELTHGNLISNTEVARANIVRAGPDDVIFGGLPLFHVFGQTVALNVAVASGACLTLLPRFDAGRALRIIAEHQVTVFEGVPTMYVALLHAPDRADYDTSSLRMCISGGAALPVEVLRGFEEAFGVPVLEGYGLSETSPVASFNHPGRERKPGSIGTPIRDVRMRVVDNEDHEVPQGEVGEIVIRGPNVMKGYWLRPEATAEAIRDGWFHSGDLARVDEDGYFYIVDRKKDLIIRGGYNVYPREIEEVLYEHPAVAEAAVIGLPHAALGEEVGAAVALKPGAVITAGELRDYVKSQVAAYKYPRHVWIMDALPKGPTGKIVKRDIVIQNVGQVPAPPGQRQLQRRERHPEAAPAIRWRGLGVGLGDRQVRGRLVQASLDQVAARAHQGQFGVCAGARREGPQQRLDGLRLPVEGQAERMVGEQPGRIMPVAGRLGVPDGLDHVAVLREPPGGPPVQRRHVLGQRPAQLQPEQVREQVVVAEPGPLGVQGHDERVRVLELEQDPFRAGTAGQEVGQLPVDPVEQRGAQEQILDLAGLAFQHLGEQVLGDRSAGTGKLRDEPFGVRVPGQGQRREAQARGPSFGPLMQ